MLIGCTKKLLEEAEIIPQKVSEEKDFFCYSAQIITVNRRKALVIINDSSRYGFVLYGVKAKDFKKISELIILGIKNCLSEFRIKDEIIEKYIINAGEPVFTKTRGPRYVGRLNKACEWIINFGDRLDTGKLYQPAATRILNEDFVKEYETKEYEHPYKLLINDFIKYAGENIISCKAVDLIVTLKLESCKVWRRIVIPYDITFLQLHKVLQVAFNWKNYHLHEFKVYDRDKESYLRVISEFDEAYEFEEKCETVIETDVRLKDYINKASRMVYTYDFGDDWEHEIVIQGTIKNYDKYHPVCLMGEGKTPPEDVGGAPGYERFLEIINDEESEDYENALNWAKSMKYEDFDIETVNRRLKYVFNELHWL